MIEVVIEKIATRVQYWHRKKLNKTKIKLGLRENVVASLAYKMYSVLYNSHI